MRRLLVIFLALFVFALGVRSSLATEPSAEEQARIMAEKKAFIETLKGKSKEEQARMIAEFNQRIFNRKTEVQEVRLENKEQLRTKLEEFKNQERARITQRVSTNLNTINDNRVDAMARHLNRLQEILDKLTERVATSKVNGKDTTAAENAITSAQAAIDSAKAAVEAQAGKDYTVTVTDESTVRSDAQAKREALMNDLKSIHEVVKLAKDAVVNAIRTSVNSLGKEEVDNE